MTSKEWYAKRGRNSSLNVYQIQQSQQLQTGYNSYGAETNILSNF